MKGQVKYGCDGVASFAGQFQDRLPWLLRTTGRNYNSSLFFCWLRRIVDFHGRVNFLVFYML